MSANRLETDYLVVGAGATAMAFVDTLLHESDASVLMVDRRHRPGGHWNDAYPFVKLHQPSAFYGVNSRELGRGSKDKAGLNEGLLELASGPELVSYFDQVMKEQFLPSGRVRYIPLSNHSAEAGNEHRVSSLVSGECWAVKVRKRVVNATLAGTQLPSTHPPRYATAPEVHCVPPNVLPEMACPHGGYVVVGAGKTGVDTCLWLLENGVKPDSIRWIMPRDAWYLDRANVQPGHDFFETTVGSVVAQLESIIDATSVSDLYLRLEKSGQLLRLDSSVAPTMYRCATVTRAELRELQRIESIVRLGRVTAIESTRVVLERGTIAARPDCLYVDCSANGVASSPEVPVFEGNTINLQILLSCQPVFSAALIAYVESHLTDPAEKNALCMVNPPPVLPLDWIRMWSRSLQNQRRWDSHEGLAQWLARSRLDAMAKTVRTLKDTDSMKKALLDRLRALLPRAEAKLPRLLAEIG